MTTLKINLSSAKQKVLPCPYFSIAWIVINDFDLNYVIAKHYMKYMIMFRMYPEFQQVFFLNVTLKVTVSKTAANSFAMIDF